MNKLRILIVDDDETNLRLLRAILEPHGYEVVCSCDGSEALEAARRDPPGLIISDILMPVMDGFQLCIQCKRDDELKQIPFVFYTATYSDAKDEEFALSLGADKFIRKPTEPVELANMLRAVIEDVAKGVVGERKPVLKGEKEVFKVYSERLIHKLEQKMLNLEREVRERKKAERELAANRDHLEELVKERTAALEAANMELEAFTHSVSHDLRGPLRAIDGFTGILMEEHAAQLDAEGKRLLGVVRENTDLMARLIEDLLELSRAGRSTMESTRIDMCEVVAAAVRQVQQQHADRHLAIKVHDLPPAIGDRCLIQQVWTNLLSNAAKFTAVRESPTIEVRGVAANNEQEYSVTDNGIGFEMGHAGKLFALFERLHSPTEFPGTGVGLAIVKRTVERHGGRVWAEGKVDEGATFYFALPNTEV